MAQSNNSSKPGRAAVGLAVLGIVYGDIGTSPIYALRECFRGVSPVPINQANILGILSLIFWALIVNIRPTHCCRKIGRGTRGKIVYKPVHGKYPKHPPYHRAAPPKGLCYWRTTVAVRAEMGDDE